MAEIPVNTLSMSLKQFHTELDRCEYCEEKPCRDACPAHCSPADFIKAATLGNNSDILRAAAEIMSANPLGGVCGCVCPDTLCMAACTHKKFDGALNIPLLQATIIQKAKELGGIPKFQKAMDNGFKVAVIGSGPAGLGAAAVLAQLGYQVDIYEKDNRPGGMMNLIPRHRLSNDVLTSDIEFLFSLGKINFFGGRNIEKPAALLGEYSAVCVSIGLWEPVSLGIENEHLAINMVDLLSTPANINFDGRVAIIGGGATAVDCAITAKQCGASHVEMIMLEKLSEMPITVRERAELIEFDIEVNGRTRVSKIIQSNGKIVRIETKKVRLADGQSFHPKNMIDLSDTSAQRTDISNVVISIGMRSSLKKEQIAGVFYAGDYLHGPKTVVQAVASGKNAATEIDAYVRKQSPKVIENHSKSTFILPGYSPIPVSLETTFFGRKIRSPYLISASPSTDGFEQMKRAYEAGWAGCVMKTAFDDVSIHIPSEYMFAFSRDTYANCDNVSGHNLDRVCREVEKLVTLWPDRLTMASTGGPVTGVDDQDASSWQSNTRKLEAAGAMGIEYSLSCPQGGDGTEGAIVSQNALLTAKIIDWVMQIGNPDVPKLFKLTAAVTAITPILHAIKKVLDKYPGKKAGITLANSFPTLAFRPSTNRKWDEGIIVGMSGEGVTPISYLTLAQSVPVGIEISGNGGPMNYKAAMDFLALGVQTVQFCTIVMKNGYGIIRDLESGTAFMMQEKGILSMQELIGIAQPDPITDFMALSATKKISAVIPELCVSCGNCARCPYLAITLDEKGIPLTDPSLCIGCSICVQKCFTGALYMRERTKEEYAVLIEK